MATASFSKNVFQRFGVGEMSLFDNERSERFLPAGITAIIALIGMMGCAVIALASEPEKHSQGMITALAVLRAGATITPSQVR
jgi:hypothetical protein